MVDYRKLLIAQMVACSEYDGGFPDAGSWMDLDSEERDALQDAADEAYKLEMDRYVKKKVL